MQSNNLQAQLKLSVHPAGDYLYTRLAKMQSKNLRRSKTGAKSLAARNYLFHLLLVTALILSNYLTPTAAVGICVSDQPSTCSGTKKIFQCLVGIHNGCNSLTAAHKSTELSVSSWTGLQECSSDSTISTISPLNAGDCKTKQSRVAAADLNGDGLKDVVVSVQLGGNNVDTSLTQYEILLLVNTGTATLPSFTTVPRDQVSPSTYVDPFKELRDGHANCGCDGGQCCDDFFRKDGFNNYGSWSNGFHGLMRGMSISLVDIVGPGNQADGLGKKLPNYHFLSNVIVPFLFSPKTFFHFSIARSSYRQLIWFWGTLFIKTSAVLRGLATAPATKRCFDHSTRAPRKNMLLLTTLLILIRTAIWMPSFPTLGCPPMGK